MIWDTTLRVPLMSCQALQTPPANRRGPITDRLLAGNKERAINESQSTTCMKGTSRGCGQPEWKGQVEAVVNRNGKDRPRPCSTGMERTSRGRSQPEWKGPVEGVVNQNGKGRPRPWSARMERAGRGRGQPE